MSDTPRVDEFCKTAGGQYTYDLSGLARHLERELAAALAQRDKAIAHLVNMLHAADELADCVGITKWDTEIDMARIFLKECGK